MAKRTNMVDETKITPAAAKPVEIGIDTQNQLLTSIIDAADVGTLDLSSIDALSQSAQTREQSYELIESMANDDVISAVLETYAEDIVETNDLGQSLWAESTDPAVLNYVTWLLDTLNVDKHICQWAHCLVTYGDVYLRLYRQSDVDDDRLFKPNENTRILNEAKLTPTESSVINEAASIRIYSSGDKYIPYVKMVDNPGEMFDLQKFGKTHGYIKAPVRVIEQTNDEMYRYTINYKMKQQDVEIYDATTFVHGCIESTTLRKPETVDIYMENVDDDNQVRESTSYTVKRGQSILYNSFRIWRELSLLEMSALLNRLTKSSIVRLLNVEVGDMPKEQVQAFMQRLKEKIEQKSSLNVDKGMAEYNNPGPIENTIYIPTHNQQGTINVQTIGTDFDPKSLNDIEYFRDKLFGSLRVLKQWFGFTDDGAGFNGGTSLTILSSRYGKSIKNYKNIICQLVTDLVNLFLIDRGLNNYINKFRIRMQDPVTQEELDRRQNTDNRIKYVSDVMQQLGDIKDASIKLKICKSLLSNIIPDSDVMNYMQEYIDSLDAAKTKKGKKDAAVEEKSAESSFGEESPFGEMPEEDNNPDIGLQL